jgi:hypothetical protein
MRCSKWGGRKGRRTQQRHLRMMTWRHCGSSSSNCVRYMSTQMHADTVKSYLSSTELRRQLVLLVCSSTPGLVIGGGCGRAGSKGGLQDMTVASQYISWLHC